MAPTKNLQCMPFCWFKVIFFGFYHGNHHVWKYLCSVFSTNQHANLRCVVYLLSLIPSTLTIHRYTIYHDHFILLLLRYKVLFETKRHLWGHYIDCCRLLQLHVAPWLNASKGTGTPVECHGFPQEIRPSSGSFCPPY